VVVDRRAVTGRIRAGHPHVAERVLAVPRLVERLDVDLQRLRPRAGHVPQQVDREVREVGPLNGLGDKQAGSGHVGDPVGRHRLSGLATLDVDRD